MKKVISVLLAAAMVTGLAGCGSTSTNTTTQAPASQASEAPASDAKAPEEEKTEAPAAEGEDASDFHIGIVTGSVSQSEDDRRGAEAPRLFRPCMARIWSSWPFIRTTSRKS